MSISEPKKEKIKSLYKKGIPVRDIAKLVPCSQATIYRVVEKKRGSHCLRINRAKCKRLPVDYRSRKYSIDELLKKYGIKSEQTLYRILVELGEPLIKPGDYSFYKTGFRVEKKK